MLVGACFLTQAVYVGVLFTFGMLFLEFERTFGWSRATISGAFSVFLLATGSTGIVLSLIHI